MKIYISGKITGDRRYKAKFREVEKKLAAAGHIVLNPATAPCWNGRGASTLGNRPVSTWRRLEGRKHEWGADLRNWPKIRAALNEYCGYTLADNEVILFLIGGAWYFMADIGLRMLTPRELYRANGFPDDYKIDKDYTGKEYGKTKQVARCGNAVPPPFATALVRANLPEWCGTTITTMAQLERLVAV